MDDSSFARSVSGILNTSQIALRNRLNIFINAFLIYRTSHRWIRRPRRPLCCLITCWRWPVLAARVLLAPMGSNTWFPIRSYKETNNRFSNALWRLPIIVMVDVGINHSWHYRSQNKSSEEPANKVTDKICFKATKFISQNVLPWDWNIDLVSL